MKKSIYALGLAGLGTYLYVQDNMLQVNNIDVSLEIDKPTCLAHISDFHNVSSSYLRRSIIESLQANHPDYIMITGDFIDSRRTNIPLALSFVEELVHIAPVYYVAGNHESRKEEYNEFESSMHRLGVHTMNNKTVDLDSFTLIGIKDYSFYDYDADQAKDYLDLTLAQLLKGTSGKKILLVHRPEWMEVYAKHEIDLVLSGHAHGGQIRIPGIGGLFAPEQGFLPTYTSGLHKKETTQMVVSRGIGNSLMPIRINNRPELIYIHIK